MTNTINNPLNMSIDKWLEHAKEYSYKMQAIEPPYDAYENELIGKIEDIRREAYDLSKQLADTMRENEHMKMRLVQIASGDYKACGHFAEDVAKDGLKWNKDTSHE